jgi:hypothetical protein
MDTAVLAARGAAGIDLNQPGTYVHWSMFTVSVANLALIAVMVVIFGAALLLPFPKDRRPQPTSPAGIAPDGAAGPAGVVPGGAAGPAAPAPSADGQAAAGGTDAQMWTARVRRTALRLLPPDKLLPDRQPAYVVSWIYVFGVAALAALGAAVASGLAIALGGADWWHRNPVGHFFNSLHLWSVELFMALLVIHLWGKFWMAAWRGRRALTWITGVVAFQASIVECFTGYLSQQNFDSQWISTNAKDAFNSAGVGAFFNAMSTGQMLLWHVVLIPIVLVALVGAHILLVRVRGVSHPLPARRAGWRDRAARRAAADADAAPWRGPTRRYDILKEGTIATGVVLALTAGLAGLLSSPDVPQVTIATWAKLAPADFLATAASELNGTSETAIYGPPYNQGTGSVQHLLVSPQTWPGVTQPVNAAQDFVLTPLAKAAPANPRLATALSGYLAATPARRLAWADAYARAVTKVTFVHGTPVLPAASAGPVPVMLTSELALARSGALDASLIAQQPFYGTNFTKPLLFLEDGAYFTARARTLHLTGAQWGIMNETGSYPGQPWLWLYTLWYQVPRFATSANVDLIAIALTGLAVTVLLLVPFIPGLRDIPRLIPVHRLIWRHHHNSQPPPGPQVRGGDPPSGKAAGRTAVMPTDGQVRVTAGNRRLRRWLTARQEDREQHALARAQARAQFRTRPGERVLAVARGAGGELLAATDRALYHQTGQSWARLGWEEVGRVDWDEQRRILMLTGLTPPVPARTVLRLTRDWGLPEVAAERAGFAKVFDQRVSLDGGAGARVVARRRPGGPGVTWLVVLDHGLDPADPQLRAELESALAALRAATGVGDGAGPGPGTGAPWWDPGPVHQRNAAGDSASLITRGDPRDGQGTGQRRCPPPGDQPAPPKRSAGTGADPAGIAGSADRCSGHVLPAV